VLVIANPQVKELSQSKHSDFCQGIETLQQTLTPCNLVILTVTEWLNILI